MPSRANVPCGSCRLCCKSLPVPLKADHGDDVGSYDHVIDADNVAFLKRRENGECVYLTELGCSIWARAPFACRYFDCRTYFHLWRAGLRPNNNERDILARGRELLELDRGRTVAGR